MERYKLISNVCIFIVSDLLLLSILLMTKGDFQIYIQKWRQQSARFLYISINLLKGGGMLWKSLER
jgi:hypothetical protein